MEIDPVERIFYMVDYFFERAPKAKKALRLNPECKVRKQSCLKGFFIIQVSIDFALIFPSKEFQNYIPKAGRSYDFAVLRIH